MARRVVDDVLGGRRAGSGGGMGRARVVVSGSRGGRSAVRTVVKANYRTVAKSGKNPGLGRASAVMRSVEYMATRPDHSKVRVERDIVTEQGRVNFRDDQEAKARMLADLAQSKDEYVYRMVMSPGVQNLTARQVEDWAQRVLESNGYQRYMIVAHAGEAGHTTNPHAHVILPTNSRLGREQFFNLRVSGDRELSWERQLDLRIQQWWQGQQPKATSQGGGTRVEIEEDTPAQPKPRVDLQLE